MVGKACPTRSNRHNPVALFFACFICALIAPGCRSGLWLPPEPQLALPGKDVRRYVYELGADRRIIEERDSSGRTVAFEETCAKGDQTLRIVPADVPSSDRRHLIIALDGTPFGLVAELHGKGVLPAFYPPIAMISVYPSTSDPAFSRILGSEAPLGFEAPYYNRTEGRMIDGNSAYLKGANEPWSESLDYQLGPFWRAVQYMAPKWFFRRELETLLKDFGQSRRKTFIAYLASTAGLGTRHGRAGYIHALLELDRLARQVMIDSRGKVTVTLLADHGHSLMPARRAPIEDFLTTRGWHVAKRLEDARDVIPIKFGLLTCAAFYTDSAEQLAKELLPMPQVELCSYRDGDTVIVLSKDGVARVDKHEGRYRYETIEGDPLGLNTTIDGLRDAGAVDAEGYIDDRPLFEATATSEYPDPLKRLWQTFDGVVLFPADVIVSLTDNSYFGRRSFDRMMPVQSTHGSLNYANSVTFAMSTAGRLEGPIRVADFRKAMKALGINIELTETAP